MSTLEDLEDLERRDRDDKKDQKKGGGGDEKKQGDGDAEMKDAEPEEDVLDDEILSLSTPDILTRKRLLENDSRIMRSEFQRLSHEKAAMLEKIKENMEKIANNRYVSMTQPWEECPMSRNADIDHLRLPVNSRILSATSLSSSTSTPPPSPRKRARTSISMPSGWASPPSSRPLRDKPYSSPSSVWLTTRRSSLVISSV